MPFGACLLSSINLSEYVTNPFSLESNFNYQGLRNDVRMIVFAMNDVLDEGISLHPLKEQSETATSLRQIGIGTMGLADALIKLQVTYGSTDSISVIKHIYKLIAEESIKASLELAKIYGSYPACEKEKLVESSFIKHLELPEEVLNDIKQYGLRNSQLLTCAPTGSIATMLGTSTGVEPVYAMHYTRTTKSLEGKDRVFEVYTPIAEEYLKTHDSLPNYFISSGDIAPIDRIKVQSALQEYIDASISSTVNLAKEATVEDVYNIYMNAWKYNLKGITVYRNGCAREGILNTESSKVEDLGENQCFNCITPVSRKTMGTTTGQTFCKKCACGTLYITANKDTNGNFVELFTHTSKGGICQANLNAETRLISLALRSGVKINEAIDQLKGIYCPACSLAKAKGQNIDGASCPDIISKVMQEFINAKSTEIPVSGDKCPECGAILTHEGGCVTCTSCGYSKCG